MKLVKLSSLNIVLTDNSDKVLKKFDPNSYVEAVGTDVLNIYSSNKLTSLKVSDIGFTRIDPAADVPFAGNADALAELLSESFFVTGANLTNFGTIPGNIIEITYYSGVVIPGNPSGNKNIQTVVYKTGATTVATKTIEYDNDDDTTKVTIT